MLASKRLERLVGQLPLVYEDLVDAMANRTQVTLVRQGSMLTGLVNGIRAEDGSGNCWLVTLHNCPAEVFVRTVRRLRTAA